MTPIATRQSRRSVAAALPEIDPLSGVRLPTMTDVARAREVIGRYLQPTPLLATPALDALLGFQAFLKCENLQPMGAFKVRGGLFLMSDLTAEERARGIVTASTGNHGQSIAYAAREFGVPATVWMPEEANPLKVASMRRLGAEVRFAGRDFDESRAEAERDAAVRGARLVAPANMLEAVPDLDVLIVPAGGGSGLSGACLAGKSLSPRLRVIGVQAAGAPVIYETWRSGQLQEIDRADTFAEGLATRVAFSLPAQILWRRLDDFRLVTDTEMRRGILTLLETARVLAEGAGAAALAAAHAMREELAGQKVGIVVSGGNLTLDALAETLAMEHAW
ncbi:MAG: Pyridoxal-5-phosphate-dependent protein beta subunit [Thermomicrobiales bacterium]|nr:Pyridoxal-5-phosphate-dependent protein beta subunit [Thermomicrobiales bacterium]